MHQRPALRHRTRRCSALFGVLLVLAGCTPAPGRFGAPDRGASSMHAGIPPHVTWTIQPDQLVQDTPVGAFRILYVLNNLTLQRALLFYAVPDSARDVPQVVSQIATANVLGTHTLGTIGSMRIGMVEVHWRDQVGQTMPLAFTLPTSNATWILTPLKQIHVFDGGGTEGFTLPPAMWDSAPVKLVNVGGRGMGNLVVRLAKESAQPALFLHVELDNQVTVISEEQFNAFTAAPPVTPPVDVPQATQAVPAVTDAPTPTLPPYPSPAK